MKDFTWGLNKNLYPDLYPIYDPSISYLKKLNRNLKILVFEMFLIFAILQSTGELI